MRPPRATGPDQPVVAAPHTTMLSVKVKPNSRASELSQASDGSWLAQLKSPPVDGKANAELIALVARHFGCSRSAVSIKAGASSRLKLVKLEPG